MPANLQVMLRFPLTTRQADILKLCESDPNFKLPQKKRDTNFESVVPNEEKVVKLSENPTASTPLFQ